MCPGSVSSFDRSAFCWLPVSAGGDLLAVRWYLRYGLSYRDVEELLAERGIEVDHVTIYRWVQRFTPLLIDAARPCRHAVGSRWFVDETYAKVAGKWRYVYRAVDQHGQVIDVFVSKRRNIDAARTFFGAALTAHGEPDEIATAIWLRRWRPQLSWRYRTCSTTPSSTPTTASSAITAALRLGFDQCAVSNAALMPWR